jgi:hypothetical protein
MTPLTSLVQDQDSSAITKTDAGSEGNTISGKITVTWQLCVPNVFVLTQPRMRLGLREVLTYRCNFGLD